MKRIIAVFLAVVMLFSVCGCGQNTENVSESSSSVAENPNIPFPESYTPRSVTLTIYGENSYGVTWNTEFEPYEPVVQVTKGDTFDAENCIEFEAVSDTETCYYNGARMAFYYITRAVMTDLEPGNTYTYRPYDKTAKIAGDAYTFKTGDSTDGSFKFVHVSDSQTVAADGDGSNPDGSGTGAEYAKTMKGIEINGFAPEFILHSGDIVQCGKYESYWASMIGDNAKYFGTLPLMAVSGNHETTYHGGENALTKHFYYNHTAEDTVSGFSYYFDYGNTRFIMLDTNELINYRLPKAEYDWLLETLKNNPQKWTIVTMHNPMYSPAGYGSDPKLNATAVTLREELGDIFAEYGVDIVLQGHDHVYAKTDPIGKGGAVNRPSYETINGVKYATNVKGTIYAMHGVSGNQPRKPYSEEYFDAGIYDKYGESQSSSWAEFEVTDELLTVKVYYYNNGSPKLWSSYGIKK